MDMSESPYKQGFTPLVSLDPRVAASRCLLEAEIRDYRTMLEEREKFQRNRRNELAFFAAVEELAEARNYMFMSPSRAIVNPNIGTSGVTESNETYFEGQAVPSADEPVRGWRAWSIMPRRKGKKEGEPTLRSITYKTQWLPKIAMHAHCNQAWSKGMSARWHENPHTAPERKCQCGMYAKLTPQGASKWAATMQPHSPFMGGDAMERYAGVPVVGIVQMWGRVLLYTEGFRAEYAYPYHLFIPEHFNKAQTERWGAAEPLAKRIRAAYACDVEVVDYKPPDAPVDGDSITILGGS